MVKDIFDRQIMDNFPEIIKTIDNFFSNKYSSEFEERASKTKIAVVRRKGVVKAGNSEVYVGSEPVCIKGEQDTIIALPVIFLGEKTGNVIFTHVVLHSLFDDTLKNKYEQLNEVLVDYFADKISKVLENKKINVTLEEFPEYKSKSFYSNCFDIVENFCKKNKKGLAELLVNGDEGLLEEMEELSLSVEEKINKLLLEDEKIKKNKRR